MLKRSTPTLQGKPERAINGTARLPGQGKPAGCSAASPARNACPARGNLIHGLPLVAFIIVLPQGILGSLRTAWRRAPA